MFLGTTVLVPSLFYVVGFYVVFFTGGSDIKSWSAEEVATWLESISLEEYASQFIRNDIRGSELLCLERRDLKVMCQQISGPKCVLSL